MRDQLNMIGIGFTDAISLAFSEQPDSLEYGKRKIYVGIGQGSDVDGEGQ